jgi:hypothetical protein
VAGATIGVATGTGVVSGFAVAGASMSAPLQSSSTPLPGTSVAPGVDRGVGVVAVAPRGDAREVVVAVLAERVEARGCKGADERAVVVAAGPDDELAATGVDAQEVVLVARQHVDLAYELFTPIETRSPGRESK